MQARDHSQMLSPGHHGQPDPFVADEGADASSSTRGLPKIWVQRMPRPYVMRHGRCYVNDSSLPYPLPCDVPELHRQTLRTLLLSRVFGAPFCAPSLKARAPGKVLEVACGSGFWSSMCDAYFAERGSHNVAFTGLDVAPLAPDLNEQGVNWRFVQHDLRKLPLPFVDDEFDFVMLKDMSLVVPSTGLQDRLMDEYLRILAPGGVLEVWESDHTLRTLLPQSSTVPGISEADQQHADDLAVFPLHPSIPGSTPQNPYLQDLNLWVRKTLERRKLTAAPCTGVGPMMLQETEVLGDQGNRRLAILLNGAKWEREGIGGSGIGSVEESEAADGDRRRSGHRVLTPEQAALRSTALLIFIQMIESMEHYLQRASGKSQDEWDRWWAGMLEDLLVKRALNGECLEVGAWWGQKL